MKNRILPILASVLAALTVTLGALGQPIYNSFAPGGALSGTNTSQTVNLSTGVFIQGNLPLSNLATIPAASILSNTSGSSATPQANNPLAIANLQQAVISVALTSTANVTLSGVQTLDGVSTVVGSVVLLTNQSTASQQGLWLVNSGAWTRPVNFPTGYVIPQNCQLDVLVNGGNTFKGHYFRLQTLDSSNVTIDTTSQTWIDFLPQANLTLVGAVKATQPQANNTWAVMTNNTPVSNAFDCVFYNAAGTAGTNAYFVLDAGNTAGKFGGCALEEVTTAHILATGTGTKPTASAGTVSNGSSDNKFTVTGLSAATSVTVTFNHGFTTAGGPPACVASSNQSLATPIQTTLTGTGPWTAVTFTFPALTGTIYGLCF